MSLGHYLLYIKCVLFQCVLFKKSEKIDVIEKRNFPQFYDIIVFMIKFDNLHFNFREIDGYNKPLNFVICEREAGKTTAIEITKILNPFLKKGLTCAYIVRKAIEITDDLIDSIQIRINRFLENQIEFIYAQKELKEGIVSIYINNGKEKKLMMKIIALGTLELQRLKKISIPNIHAIIFDEYIVNPRLGEKYVKQEAFKIKELFTTLNRFAYKPNGLRAYFCGNPYSKYNPLFIDLKVNTNTLHSGARIVGDNYIIECYKITEELKAKILKENPFYEFDDTYKKYAFDGEYVNDNSIKIQQMPSNYFLKFVFNKGGIYLGIFKNDIALESRDKYYVKKIKFNEVRKSSFCFDFDDLVEGSILMSSEERGLFSHFKCAMRNRVVAFESVECYYLIEEIYKQL